MARFVACVADDVRGAVVVAADRPAVDVALVAARLAAFFAVALGADFADSLGVDFAAAFVGVAFPALLAARPEDLLIFLAARAVVGFGFCPGVLAAVAPVARLVAVATCAARAVFFPGALLAPATFLAPVGLVATRVLAILTASLDFAVARPGFPTGGTSNRRS